MPYRFRRGETLGAGTRRIAREIIDRTVRCLGDRHLPQELRTHEARKAVKRLRGLVRLVGPEVKSQGHLKALDESLKQTGKLLADWRDSDVLRATLAEVAREAREAGDGGDAPAPAAPPLDGKTIAERRRAFGHVIERLGAIRCDIAKLSLAGNRPQDLKSGYVDTYRSSRKRMKKALSKRSAAQLHRWRQMVKYHSYHTNLLTNLDGGGLARRRAESKALAETLGRHHDLAMLESHLAATVRKKSKKLAGVRVDKLKRRIRENRRATEREALRLGKALFAKKPAKAEKDLPL